MAVKVNIVNMPSPKHSGRRVRTQLGVLHSAECPLKRGYPMSLTQWTIDTAVQASWQEFVGPGVVVQSVHSDYIAWHASVANWISWGTEQTGYAAYSRAQWLTKDGRDQLERLAMQWAGDAKYFGWKLEDLRWLPTSTVRAIVAGQDTHTKGFCTHAQVDPASRSDPGPNYPYDLLLNRVRFHFTGALQSGTVTEIEKDWFDMATEKDLEAIIDRRIDALQSRLEKNIPAKTLDLPVTLKGDTEGETTLRNKIAWLAHEQHRTHAAITAVDGRVVKLAAEHVAITAAVKAVDDSQGIEPERLEQIVAERVDAALADYTLTLSPGL